MDLHSFQHRLDGLLVLKQIDRDQFDFVVGIFRDNLRFVDHAIQDRKSFIIRCLRIDSSRIGEKRSFCQVRAECLSEIWFLSFDDAQEKMVGLSVGHAMPKLSLRRSSLSGGWSVVVSHNPCINDDCATNGPLL